MSTAAAALPVVVKYAPGDVVRVKDYKEQVKITSIISTSSPIGYSGVYTAYYQGRPVEMTLSWIPQGLIEAHLYSPSWR
jgi:hypothetical protein